MGVYILENLRIKLHFESLIFYELSFDTPSFNIYKIIFKLEHHQTYQNTLLDEQLEI